MLSKDDHVSADGKPIHVEVTEHTRDTTPLKSPEEIKVKVLSIKDDLEKEEQAIEHKDMGAEDSNTAHAKVQMDQQKWMARAQVMGKEHDKTEAARGKQDAPQEESQKTASGASDQKQEKPSEAMKPSRVGGGHLSSIDSDYGLLHKAGTGKSDPSTADKIKGVFGVNPK